jgi:DNA-binding helix-hairpin-helix protein with protein kinase domain
MYIRKLIARWSIPKLKSSFNLVDDQVRQISVQLDAHHAKQTELERRIASLSLRLRELRVEETEKRTKLDADVAQLNSQVVADKQNLEILKVAWNDANRVTQASKNDRRSEHERRLKYLNELDNQKRAFESQAISLTEPEILRVCRGRVNDAKRQYESIQNRFLAELESLKRESHSRQMQVHLEQFEIAKARLNGIHNSLVVALRSNGIETAADISVAAVLRVRGFGEKRTALLMNWRMQKESTFRFDPSRQLTPQDRELARQKFANEIHAQESVLKRVGEELRLAFGNAKAAVDRKERELAALNEIIGQARADAAVPL